MESGPEQLKPRRVAMIFQPALESHLAPFLASRESRLHFFLGGGCSTQHLTKERLIGRI